MDKKSIIGLVLIGVILAGFTIFNQPTPEEIAEKEKVEAKKQEVSSTNSGEKIEEESEVVSDKKEESENSNLSSPEEKVFQKEEFYRLENSKLIVDFSSKGGKVAAVYLKEFESYHNFSKEDDKIQPLRLFGKGDAINELSFPVNGGDFKTGLLNFKVQNRSKDKITFKHKTKDGKVVQFTYALNENAYDLDYNVKLKGFEKNTSAKNIQLNWSASLRKTERLFKSQRMVSTVCYMNNETGLDYLSEASDDEDVAEEDIQWVAFKQSYFSSILKPKNSFGKTGTSFKIRNYNEGDKKQYSHLKDYTATLNLNLDNAEDVNVSFNWFFGPNDFDVLKSYESGYDDIINFGWGLFRWINIYAVNPIFEFFSGTLGLGIGISILFLTLVLKLILMPIQWKMYVSSAKMRILKPEIDELNAKFPNKEDAMKKQVEMMALYKESGASPLAGCVPMLIQMPILLAVFRFFPASFEMRQKSFLWADDLSSFDSIYDFGVNIWPYGDHVSLFTLLMSATTLIYTWLNSGNTVQPQQPGMPNMKVIMYIFPIMMIFIFNDYAAGLSYYYFISTLISILLMVAIKNLFVDEEKLKAKMAAKKANNSTQVKKKSKFQERLEAMQKMQQEQKNARKK